MNALSKEIVDGIYECIRNGKSIEFIAKNYGISEGTIRNNCKKWYGIGIKDIRSKKIEGRILYKCRYCNCLHGIPINITKDKYVVIGKSHYYHEDCYEDMRKRQMIRDSKNDGFVEFKNLWINSVNKSVVLWQLKKVYYDLVNRGISPDRIVFTLRYILENKKNLKHPNGFYYYMDYDEIKEAYLEKKRKDIVASSPKFTAKNTQADDAPTFKVPKRKRLEDLFD